MHVQYGSCLDWQIDGIGKYNRGHVGTIALPQPQVIIIIGHVVGTRGQSHA